MVGFIAEHVKAFPKGSMPDAIGIETFAGGTKAKGKMSMRES